MLSAFRTVFFDAGFTLLAPVTDVADVYLDAARALGANPDPTAFRAAFQEAWTRVAEAPRSAEHLATSDAAEHERWRSFTKAIAIQFDDVWPLHEAWLAHLVAHFDHPAAWRPLPGAIDLLQRLREREIPTAVVSNWHSALHRILAAHGIRDLVDAVLTSAECGRMKPHPAIFHHALTAVGATPETTAHVGDSWRDDVEGARRAGLTPILVQYSQDRESLADGPGRDDTVTVVASLTKLLAR